MLLLPELRGPSNVVVQKNILSETITSSDKPSSEIKVFDARIKDSYSMRQSQTLSASHRMSTWHYLHQLADFLKHLLLAVCGLEDAIELELVTSIRAMLQAGCHTLEIEMSESEMSKLEMSKISFTKDSLHSDFHFKAQRYIGLGLKEITESFARQNKSPN
jgi:hypothetical protein